MNEPPAATVVSQAADSVTLQMALLPELAVFRGHFPGQPILPGVAQLDWALRLAARHLGLSQPVAQRFQVKYRNVIVPPAEIEIELRLDTARRRLTFAYRQDGRMASQGSIALDPDS